MSRISEKGKGGRSRSFVLALMALMALSDDQGDGVRFAFFT
jgi:hypothetical protein